jgi:hypothetical protein
MMTELLKWGIGVIPVREAGSRLLIEWLITKVGPDALLLGAFRGGAVG